MALTDAFKLSIDVQLGTIELVTPVLAKTISPTWGRDTKAENIYHCPNACESCGKFICMDCNLLYTE